MFFFILKTSFQQNSARDGSTCPRLKWFIRLSLIYHQNSLLGTPATFICLHSILLKSYGPLLDNPVLFLDFSCHLIHQQLPVLFLINTDDHLDRVSGDSRQTNERHRNILEDESEQNFGPCCDSCFLGRNRLRSNPEEHFADLDRRPGEEQPERV